MSMPERILIGGGGTGGHVFPAIAIGNAIKKANPAADLLFVGALGKIEMEKVPEAGYKIIGLPVAGFQRKLSIRNFTFFFKLLASMYKSGKIIRNFRPDLAIGVGGYASGPILKAAASRGIPVYIQEQNSFAGMTNRLLARKARKIFVAYEGMEKYFPAGKIVLSGNPVRSDIPGCNSRKEEANIYFNLKEYVKTILVIGGSLGAGTINRSILSGLSKLKDFQLLWQTGKTEHDQIKEALTGKDQGNIRLLPFIRKMDLAFASADIIISRAGAGTISELAIVGKPVILVPSPNVAEDHQTKNAMSLVSKDAAIHIPDSTAEENLVDTCLSLLNDPERMQTLSDNIIKLAIPDAADRIAMEILNME